MAADLNYTVGVNTTQAQANLEKLKGTIRTTSDSFSKFRELFAGLAFASFIRSAYDMADSISEIGIASGMGTQFVIGFTNAIKQNGGELESAQQSFGKFAQNIQSGLQGNKDVIKSFQSLGISLSDLANMSDKDLLKQTIAGLAAMGDGSVKVALAQDLLGKKMASVDFAGVNQGLSEYVALAAGSAGAVDSAGQAHDSFNGAITTLQGELLKVLQPISEMIVSVGKNTEAIRNWISIIFKIGMVLATFTLVGKAVQVVVGIFGALGTAVGSIVSFVTAARNGFVGFGAILENFAGVSLISRFRIIGNLLGQFGEWAKIAIPGVAALGVALGFVWDSAKGVVNSVLSALGLSSKETDAATAAAEATKKAADDKASAEAALAAKRKLYAEQYADAYKKYLEVSNKEISNVARVIGGYKASNEEKLKAMNYSIASLTMTEKEKSMYEARQAAEADYNTQMTSLRQRYSELASSSNKDEIAQLPLVQAAMAKLTQEYTAQVGEVEKLTLALDAEQAKRQLSLFKTAEQIKSQDELIKLQDEMAKMTMPAIEQKYYDIDAAAKASAKSAIEAEEARRGSKLNPQEVQAYYDAALQGSAKLKAQTKANYDASRSWNTGWQKAFNDYKENATNAAKQAEAVFSKATSGMEDMIVNFAKTGKFEWKGFVADMLEQLLRSQIQQVFAQMMGNMQGSMSGVTGGGSGGGGGLGGLLGSVGSLFGGGSKSGQTPPYAPAQSNSGGGFGDILGSIGGGISSAISGIGDFFGGFFANGGNLGAGKWGIAGENGPELISGPATVTPMGSGGSTNVTYHINAVDAMSFKQLVAQDPGFIHAVVMQGAKSAPGTWR